MKTDPIERQKESIRDYMLLGLSLNALEAVYKFGCLKVSTRIGELEREGKLPLLNRKRITVKTRWGKTSVMEYQLPQTSKVTQK